MSHLKNKHSHKFNSVSKRQLNVGINGFGRIGRQILRMNKNLNVVAINSPANIQTAIHLLKYDSVHGVYKGDVSIDKDGIQLNHKKIHYVSYAQPQNIPWNKWNVDVVLECSGMFKQRKDLEGHFKGKAKQVILAYPAAAAVDATLIYGVNHQQYQKEHLIISLGSCTTNCLAPMVKTLHQHFCIEELFFTTTHAYTLDQKLLDSTHKKDLRRARAAALSMIPTSTGASAALNNIFPELKNKIAGMAVRVPTPNVSLVDLVFRAKKPLDTHHIKESFLSAQNSNLKNILYCETNELVSIDFSGSPYSCIVDMPSIAAGNQMAKILAWYDNESGFAQRMIDFTHYLSC